MNKHEQCVAAAFNQSAATYHQHNDIQAAVGQYLIHQLHAIRTHFPRVIDAGCGTGDTTLELANSINYDFFSAIDIADELLSQARQRTSFIDFIHDDFNHIASSSTKHNLIFSNLALHWSHNLALTFRVMREALHQDGLLAFSIPLAGTFTEIEHDLSIHHFRSRADIETMLSDARLHILHIDNKIYRKEFPDTLSALRYLKLTGTNYVPERRHHSLHAKSFLSRLHIQMLTYQVGFFIASKQNG